MSEIVVSEAVGLMDPRFFTFQVEIKNFKPKPYAVEFEAYAAYLAPAWGTLQRAAEELGIGAAANAFAAALLPRFEACMGAHADKENASWFITRRYTTVAFTVPAILENHGELGDAVADAFLALWNTRWPKNKLGKTTRAAIASGFKTKLCFVTTAVCRSLGKPDDCRELTAFRDFRDNYYAGTKNGPRRIGEYYLYAPLLVRNINKSAAPADVYGEIWRRHLRPCLHELDAGRPALCAQRYEHMMRLLESEWL